MGVEWTLIITAITATITVATTLALTQRTERREAKIAARQLLAALAAARDQLEAITSNPKAVWWEPARGPSTDAWDRHHKALISQLPLETVRLIEDAVDQLRRTNAIAATDHDTYTQGLARYQEIRRLAEEGRSQAGDANPVQAVKDDPGVQKLLDANQPTLRVQDSDRVHVKDTLGAVTSAHGALDREADRAGRLLLYRTAAVAGAIVAILLVVGVARPWTWFSDRVSETRVATQLKAELADQGASNVDCDTLPGRTDAWNCLVSYGADETCPVAAGGWPAVAVAADDEKACGTYGAGLERWQVEEIKHQKRALTYRSDASPARLDDRDRRLIARGRRLFRGLFPVSVDDAKEARSLELDGDAAPAS